MLRRAINANNGIITSTEKNKLNVISVSGKDITLAGGIDFKFLNLASCPACTSGQYNWAVKAPAEGLFPTFSFADGKTFWWWNQADNTVSNPKLNVNNTGAFPLVYDYFHWKNPDRYGVYVVKGPELVSGYYLLVCRTARTNNAGDACSTNNYMIVHAPYRFWLACIKRDLGLS